MDEQSALKPCPVTLALCVADWGVWREELRDHYEARAKAAIAAMPDALPQTPKGSSLFAVNTKTGAWHYINHANTWQGMPNPLTHGQPDAREVVAGLVEALANLLAVKRGEGGTKFDSDLIAEQALTTARAYLEQTDV